jgi:phenylalanyl-tRNA synthetase alpha chain
LRVAFLGKKGELTQILKGMKDLSKEERPVIGQLGNEVRTFIENEIEARKTELETAAQEAKLKEETLDVTMPGTIHNLGHKHPMTQVIDNIKNIFIGMGYEIAEGPEVERAYYNFEALNIPKDHPARDEQDTFYVEGEGDFLLRTQTSPVQVRVMEQGKLPIKVISPGRVYRADEVDATHSPIFHQLEGLVVDKGITMGDLKGALAVFAKELFGEDTKVRFRPHHFPFTEPSAEMDASCFACGGKGCRVCKDSGWIEVLGCGMVHPDVLKMSGIDPEVYSGFAFGMGLERVTMQKYAIKDLRLLFENDSKFLKQF